MPAFAARRSPLICWQSHEAALRAQQQQDEEDEEAVQQQMEQLQLEQLQQQEEDRDAGYETLALQPRHLQRASSSQDKVEVVDIPVQVQGPIILHKSSKALYRAVAAQWGITCKMNDHCRCLDCQVSGRHSCYPLPPAGTCLPCHDTDVPLRSTSISYICVAPYISGLGGFPSCDETISSLRSKMTRLK